MANNTKSGNCFSKKVDECHIPDIGMHFLLICHALKMKPRLLVTHTIEKRMVAYVLGIPLLPKLDSYHGASFLLVLLSTQTQKNEVLFVQTREKKKVLHATRVISSEWSEKRIVCDAVSSSSSSPQINSSF